MSFLVLLLAVVIEKFSGLRQQVQCDGAWLRALTRLETAPQTARHPWLILALVVLVPVLVLHLALLIIGSVAYGWVLLPVHVLVLIYSLGRGDVLAALGPFRDACRRGDVQAAVHVAERDMDVRADDGQQLIAGVQKHLLWQAYQGFFAVLFWYALLGPVVALAYRLLALAAEKAGSKAVAHRAGQLRHAFDWIPVRLLAASFALVGNFAAVSRELLQDLLNWNISAARLISRVGCAASEVPAPSVSVAGVNSLDLIWELLVRAAIVWYAAFALWTLLF